MTTPLRLGHKLDSLRPSLHNGPGWRIGLWVQGCRLRCTTRCLSPHLLATHGGHLYPAEAVAAAVLAVAEAADVEIEGVTVLGGEPTEQAGPLTVLLAAIRARGLGTMVYTGYTAEQLRAAGNTEVDGLLAQVDLLVDGPFLSDAYDEALAWRGSRNQRLLCLTDRYDAGLLETRHAAQGKGFSILVRPDGRASVSGLQEAEGARGIALRLRGRGG